ncbi:MAG TPA: flavin reductase family protein [Candidatus Limnocylindrales bacterium]|nr:flavin reductase family protein [Candidatus Limnocylindrales bacterium]
MTIDAAAYRKIMGNFATGVTVVTTCNDGRLHGFTANSVTGLSLEPLLLLVCVDKKAHALSELRICQSFAVNMLAAGQKDISNLFAKSAPPDDCLRGVPYRLGDHGAPVIDGTIAHFECKLYDDLDGGDHVIFVGEVVGGEVTAPDTMPLLYFRGAYRELGPVT